MFKVAFAIRHVLGDVVDRTHGAVAYASCTDCAAVAMAFEIVVVVEESPSTVTRTNVAIAFDENCDMCVAVVEAYQFVLGIGGLVSTSIPTGSGCCPRSAARCTRCGRRT